MLLSFLYSAGYPELIIQKNDLNSLEYQFNGSLIDENDVETPLGTFTRLSFENSSLSDIPGSPEMPVIRRIIEVPQGAIPVIEITNIRSYEVIYHKRIFPNQLPVIKMRGADTVFTYNAEAYQSNDYLFRGEDGTTVFATLTEMGTARSHRLFLLEVRPIDYNPSFMTLRVLTEATIKISFPEADINRTIAMKSRYGSFYFDKVLEGTVDNLDAFSPLYVPPVDIGMLIITRTTYSDTLQKYARWKKRKGFKTSIHTTTETGTTTTSIKNFIQSKYDTAAVPPTFVILIGDVADIPVFTGTSSSYNPRTDLNYARLSGTDYVPDVFLGRWSLTSVAQMDEFMNRNINYEKFNYSGSTAWTLGACLPSTDDASYHTLAEATQRYVSQTHYQPRGYTAIDTIKAYYGGTGAQVRAAINEGRMIVNYTGHGDSTLWDAPAMSQTNIQNLTNTNKYPFVVSNACLTNTFIKAECFGETWIRQTGKGAIAFLGASCYTYWNEDDAFQRRATDSTFLASWCFTDGFKLKGQIATATAYPSRAQYYYEIYHILGDPSVALWFTTPVAMTASHPVSISSSGGAFSVTVTSSGSPVQNALVCVTNDNLIHYAAYSNASGVATFTLPSALTAFDTMHVTVTAYNKIPYFGTCVVTGNTPFLSYISHTVDDDALGGTTGDMDGLPDSGERIGLLITIRNSGAVTANTVTGRLRTLSPYITRIDSVKSYGNIAASANATNSTPFIVDISPGIPNNQLIEFILNLKDSRDSTWNTTFSIVAFAPVLSTTAYTFTGGDGDEFAEPGEVLNLNIPATNNGKERARNVNGILSTSDPYITITTSAASYGTVDSGSIVNPASPYVIRISSSCPSPYFATLTVDLNELRGYACHENITFRIGNAGFRDDVEGGDLGYTSNYPFITNHRFSSNNHSWYFGRDYYFSYRDTFTSTLTTPELLAPASPVLSFSHYYETEKGFDTCFVSVSTNSGSTWTNVANYNGFSNGWKLARINLASVVPDFSNLLIRFSLKADAGLNDEGWYIDDILLSSTETLYR
jgi:hypothetical protein